MATRNRAQREEQKEFVGRVDKWRKIPVTIGDSIEGNNFVAQKWAVTDEKTTTPDGPRFPHLVPFPNPNKVKALQLRNYGDIARNVQPPPVALPPQKIKLKLPSMASLQSPSPPAKANPPQ